MRPWAVAAWLVLNAAPETLTLPGFRLHLQLSEDVEPERLEALGRPGVVLWLETASNSLKRSVVERLERTEATYVQVRPPFGAGLRQQYSGHIHPWVALEGLDVSAFRRWAPGGSAVEWAGALTEERLGSLQALRPQTIHWRPEAPPTPEEWARAARLTGLEVHSQDVLPPCTRPLTGAARIRLRVKVPEAETSAAGCGFALRLEVPLTISEAELRVLLVQYPGAELWAQLASEAEAATAEALVRLLVSAVPPARGTPSSGAH